MLTIPEHLISPLGFIKVHVVLSFVSPYFMLLSCLFLILTFDCSLRGVSIFFTFYWFNITSKSQYLVQFPELKKSVWLAVGDVLRYDIIFVGLLNNILPYLRERYCKCTNLSFCLDTLYNFFNSSKNLIIRSVIFRLIECVKK